MKRSSKLFGILQIAANHIRITIFIILFGLMSIYFAIKSQPSQQSTVSSAKQIASATTAETVKAPQSDQAKIWPRADSNGFIFKNEVVTDIRTGLMWARNGNIAGKRMSGGDAKSWVKKLNYGGYSDWRLPSVEEIETFAKLGGNSTAMWFNANGFNNVQASLYRAYNNLTDGTVEDRVVFIDYGDVPFNKGGNYVWPVRDDHVSNIETGQTQASVGAQQKRELSISSDNNEFIIKNDVVTDIRTGLMWTRNGNIANNLMDWQTTTAWVKNLKCGGYSDWRLPTRDELLAFAKRGGSRPSVWFNANGFSDVQSFYWSSSPYQKNDEFFWVVNMRTGHASDAIKICQYCVWPVRGGQ